MRGDPGGARARPWGGWGGGRGHLGASEALLVGTHLLGLSAAGRPVLGWPQAGWLWTGRARMGSGEVRDGGRRSAWAAGQGPCWSRAGSRVQMTREPPTGQAERLPASVHVWLPCWCLRCPHPRGVGVCVRPSYSTARGGGLLAGAGQLSEHTRVYINRCAHTRIALGSHKEGWASCWLGVWA